MGFTDVLKDALTGRGELIGRLTKLKAKFTSEAAAQTKAIAMAQAEVDKLDEPRRRLERLKAEEYGTGLVADRQILELENQLRDPSSWPRVLRLFVRDLVRLREVWSQPLEFREEHNSVTGEVRLSNAKDFENRAEAVKLLVRAEREVHGGLGDRPALWKLDRAALGIRIKEIRRELAEYDRDMIVAVEPEDAESAPEATA